MVQQKCRVVSSPGAAVVMIRGEQVPKLEERNVGLRTMGKSLLFLCLSFPCNAVLDTDAIVGRSAGREEIQELLTFLARGMGRGPRGTRKRQGDARERGLNGAIYTVVWNSWAHLCQEHPSDLQQPS